MVTVRYQDMQTGLYIGKDSTIAADGDGQTPTHTDNKDKQTADSERQTLRQVVQ